jgi:micrococcal nuclease
MSNHIRFKRQISTRTTAPLIWGTFLVFLFACVLVPTSAPTSDSDALSTYASQTSQVSSLQTRAAPSPTQELTFISLPTTTDTLLSLPAATETPTPLSGATSAAVPVTGADCIPNEPPQTGRALEVIDGDTIVVRLDQSGKDYSVRYIGIDAPEDDSQVEFFGPEATAKNRELVYGKIVTLIRDVSETDRDGRLLRYVIADGVFVNYELVALGFARVASSPPDTACIPTFQAAEKLATGWRIGLWGAPPRPTPLPPPPSPGASPVCSCEGNQYNCSDFPSRASAQACYDYCSSLGYGDIHRLDGSDKNGIACDDLP